MDAHITVLIAHANERTNDKWHMNQPPGYLADSLGTDGIFAYMYI